MNKVPNVCTPRPLRGNRKESKSLIKIQFNCKYLTEIYQFSEQKGNNKKELSNNNKLQTFLMCLCRKESIKIRSSI